ncbi:MAG: hypothetical protein ACYC3I_20800 [Gemmataceae bacterium]
MKRLFIGGLVALGLAMTAAPASADCYFDFSCCRHMCFVRTSKNRCWSFQSCCNPLPCISSCGSGGIAPWNALAAYGPGGYAVAAAPVAAVPAAAAPAPAASQPTFRGPQPTPAASSTTGVQQAGYYPYGQPNYAGYGSSPGYNYYGYGYYGYGAGYSYAQVPNYWY